MLRRVFRKTQFGRQHDVFNVASQKMLFGTFALDSAGNVMCLFRHRHGQSAGSWSVVAHDSCSWPMHWWAIQQREQLTKQGETLTGMFDPRLCKSPMTRRLYKLIRYLYLGVVAYAWFLLYLLAKQNALNQEARMILTDLEKGAVRGLSSTVFEKMRLFSSAGTAGDDTIENNDNNASTPHHHQEEEAEVVFLRRAGRMVRDLAFAGAEDLGCFDPELDMEDRIEMAIREQKRRSAKSMRSSSPHERNSSSEQMWKAAGIFLGIASLLFLI